jgi:hypothetical protein
MMSYGFEYAYQRFDRLFCLYLQGHRTLEFYEISFNVYSVMI